MHGTNLLKNNNGGNENKKVDIVVNKTYDTVMAAAMAVATVAATVTVEVVVVITNTSYGIHYIAIIIIKVWIFYYLCITYTII